MEYALDLGDGPMPIAGGTGLLLLHPITGSTDQVDTAFLSTDTDAFLVISTRTTAHEVEQKLEYYEVNESKAVILDTLSVERGYSRRSGDNVHYVSSPSDLDGILQHTREFLDTHDGKRRVTIDSVSELTYYAEDEDVVFEAMCELHDLLTTYDAVGLFHISEDVHNEEMIERYRDRFDGEIHVDNAGTVHVTLG